MRKVTFGVASSLDNFIARADHAVDWLLWGPEAAAVTATFWKTIDAVVMGRKTYEVALKNGTTSYPGVKNYVSTRWGGRPTWNSWSASRSRTAACW
jgi:dihydrofolate reductase